jgi:hypothetical protein
MASGVRVGSAAKWGAAGLGVGIAAYGAYAGAAWLRYGHPTRTYGREKDRELDRFIPQYDVVERHRVYVNASASRTFAAACQLDMLRSPLVRAIFKGRELLLGSTPDEVERPHELLALTKALGWGMLAHIPGREIIMGAVTQPWKSDVVFRPVPPADFAAFHEPDYVKIAWTLRADPVGDDASIFRTETRAVATDSAARGKFRAYWSLLSPGIVLIRLTSLGLVRRDAERRQQGARTHELTPVGVA